MRVKDGELREILLRYPTINAQVLVTAPAGYDVLTSMDLDRIERKTTYERPGAIMWDARNVYLPGQRFWIRQLGATNGAAAPPAAPSQTLNANVAVHRPRDGEPFLRPGQPGADDVISAPAVSKVPPTE